MSTSLVHIVDDDEAIRDALAWLLQTRHLTSATWPSGEAFLAGTLTGVRGCVVMDIRMGGMSGLECFDQMLERGDALPVIFLTGHGDVPLAVEALRKGAYHFIEKPFNDNDLVKIVQQALARDAARCEAMASQASVSARQSSLSPREQEVMERILNGKLNKQIADELGISIRTVEVHRARIFEKMGVRSAVELSQLLSGQR